MMHPPGCDRIRQRSRDMFLSDDLAKRLRPVFARQHQIRGHVLQLSKKGGSGHPFGRLPLLPSGSGGVHRLHVAQSHKSSTVFSGERGIRTLGTSRYTRFPIVPLRPLGHLSGHRAAAASWENSGEGGIRTPGGVTPTPDFESGAFDLSATSPDLLLGGSARGLPPPLAPTLPVGPLASAPLRLFSCQPAQRRTLLHSHFGPLRQADTIPPCRFSSCFWPCNRFAARPSG